MNRIRSDQITTSRYAQGGDTDVIGTRLGWWERKILPRSASDIKLTVTPMYALRPDLIAYDLYGRSDLQWFILQYNNVSDLQRDFAVGSEIVLPTRSRVFSELLTRSM